MKLDLEDFLNNLQHRKLLTDFAEIVKEEMEIHISEITTREIIETLYTMADEDEGGDAAHAVSSLMISILGTEDLDTLFNQLLEELDADEEDDE